MPAVSRQCLLNVQIEDVDVMGQLLRNTAVLAAVVRLHFDTRSGDGHGPLCLEIQLGERCRRTIRQVVAAVKGIALEQPGGCGGIPAVETKPDLSSPASIERRRAARKSLGVPRCELGVGAPRDRWGGTAIPGFGDERILMTRCQGDESALRIA